METRGVGPEVWGPSSEGRRHFRTSGGAAAKTSQRRQPQPNLATSPTDDAARTFAGGQSCQRVVDAVEIVGASDKFAELQFTGLIERDEVRDVQQRTPRTVERADQALLLHHEREGGD